MVPAGCAHADVPVIDDAAPGAPLYGQRNGAVYRQRNGAVYRQRNGAVYRPRNGAACAERPMPSRGRVD